MKHVPHHFPFPPFAANPDEAAAGRGRGPRQDRRIMNTMDVLTGPEVRP